MPAGRCAGCGYSDSARKVQVHALTCPDYLTLFQDNPQQCQDPVAEHARYQLEDNTVAARAQRRDGRLRRRYAEVEQLQLRQTERWRRRDILED